MVVVVVAVVTETSAQWVAANAIAHRLFTPRRLFTRLCQQGVGRLALRSCVSKIAHPKNETALPRETACRIKAENRRWREESEGVGGGGGEKEERLVDGLAGRGGGDGRYRERWENTRQGSNCSGGSWGNEEWIHTQGLLLRGAL